MWCIQNRLQFMTLNPPEEKRRFACRCTSRGSQNFRKILVSVKFVSAILGRKWLRQFYGRLEKCALSAGKPMSIKFRVLGGRVWGGGKCRFYFYGRIFLKIVISKRVVLAEVPPYRNFFQTSFTAVLSWQKKAVILMFLDPKAGMTAQSPNRPFVSSRTLKATVTRYMRAENGALDPWSLNLRFWGAPIFSPIF